MGFPSALYQFNKLGIWSLIDFLYYFFSKSLLASSAEISFIVSPQHLMPQFSQVQSINTLTIAPHFSQSTILSIIPLLLLIESFKQADQLIYGV